VTASIGQKPASTKNSSRRAMLAGVLGGIGAVAAGAIARVNPVRGEGETMVVGGAYTTAQSVTSLRNTANNEAVFEAISDGYGKGIAGSSSSYVGVHGSSTNSVGVLGTSAGNAAVYGDSGASVGVFGRSQASGQSAMTGWSIANGTGVLGTSAADGAGSVPTAKPKTGVYGYAVQGGGSRGVWGETTKGQAVRGQATSGVGLYGRAWGSGHALAIRGRFKAEQISGVATIPAGSTGVTINPGVRVNAGSFVLLTPKANIGSRGLWFATNTGANTFRIRMSSTRSANTKVAWLLLG
jgi:hypothetical protein